MSETHESVSTGFDHLQNSRSGMVHWNLLSRLSAFGKNREACAIVESFQRQIAFENAAASRNLHEAA